MDRNQIIKNQQIEQDLKYIKAQEDYEFLIMLGEANTIQQQKGSSITYWIFDSANEKLLCNVYDHDLLVQTLTKTEFIRELKTLKQDMILNQNKKQMGIIQEESPVKNQLSKKILKQDNNFNEGDQKEKKLQIIKNVFEKSKKMKILLEQQILIFEKNQLNKCLVDKERQ